MVEPYALVILTKGDHWNLMTQILNFKIHI